MTRPAMPLYPDEATIAAQVVGPKRAKDWPGIAAAFWSGRRKRPPIATGRPSGCFWQTIR